jgi:phage gp45-like
MYFEHDDALRSATRRARVVKVDDSKSQQRIDITGLKNEAPKKIWRPQDFGYSSNPPKDSDGIIDQMGSRSDRTVYRDAGHEKYRPKNTPEGGTVLFNHTGDIIRVFKDKLDVVHSKTVNIKIGKGYNAGQADGSSDGSPDDASKSGDENISIVMTANDVTITKGQTFIKLTSTNVLVQAAQDCAVGVNGRFVRVRPGRVDLGVTTPTGQATPAVQTDAGPSTIVFAEI